MRKLILTCECGERMQVPRSALGKTGLCPACSRAIPIRTDNTEPAPFTGSFATPTSRNTDPEQAVVPADDDKRRFGQAVDLYFARRYAEALAVFNTLAERLPDNPEVNMGRTLCLKALQNRPTLALEDKRNTSSPLALTEDTVRRLIVHLMVHGSTEEVQLKAAELACRILGMVKNGDTHAKPSEPPIHPLLEKLHALQQTVEEALRNNDGFDNAEPDNSTH